MSSSVLNPSFQSELPSASELRGDFYNLLKEVGNIEVPWIVDLGYTFRAWRFMSADHGFIAEKNKLLKERDPNSTSQQNIGYLSASTALALQTAVFGPQYVYERLHHQQLGMDPKDSFKVVRFGNIEDAQDPNDIYGFGLYRALFGLLQVSAYSSAYNINPFSRSNWNCYGAPELRHVYSQARHNSHSFFIYLLRSGMSPADVVRYFGTLVDSETSNVSRIYDLQQPVMTGQGRNSRKTEEDLQRFLKGLYAETFAISQIASEGEGVIHTNVKYDSGGVDLISHRKDGRLRYIQVKGRSNFRWINGRNHNIDQRRTKKGVVILDEEILRELVDSNGDSGADYGLLPRDVHGIASLLRTVAQDRNRLIGQTREGFGTVNSIVPVVMVVDTKVWRG